MKLLLISLLVCFLVVNISCAPTGEQEEEVIKYLKSFGYIPVAKNTTKISHKQLHHGLRRLQV